MTVLTCVTAFWQGYRSPQAADTAAGLTDWGALENLWKKTRVSQTRVFFSWGEPDTVWAVCVVEWTSPLPTNGVPHHYHCTEWYWYPLLVYYTRLQVRSAECWAPTSVENRKQNWMNLWQWYSDWYPNSSLHSALQVLQQCQHSVKCQPSTLTTLL